MNILLLKTTWLKTCSDKSLLKYFSLVKTKDGLPDPTGHLSEVLPSTSIEEANKEVSAELASVDPDSGKKRRSAYMVATLEQKAKVAKYAAENGTTKAIRHFAKDMPELKESTVRGWRTAYLRELTIKVEAGKGDLSVKKLPAVEKGRPLLLGQELDRQKRAYLTDLMSNHNVRLCTAMQGKSNSNSHGQPVLVGSKALCLVKLLLVLLN